MTTSDTRLDPRPPASPPHDRGRGLLSSLAVGIAGLVVVLAALDLSGAVGASGWTAGLACATLLGLLVVRGLGRAGRDTLLPADLVTLARALLGCAAAAVVVESPAVAPAPTTLLVLAVPALALDAVDGRVARRTGTVSPFGARFDGETDAFLILVLSLAAAPTVGWWVLAAGLARYLFGAAGWALPWLRRPLPFRYWRKVVTGTVGVALALVAAGVLDQGGAASVAVIALLLLTESFGRDVWWLWRTRPVSHSARGRQGRLRAAGRVAAVCATLPLAWFALLAPGTPDQLTTTALLRLPAEALVVLCLALVLPARVRRAGMALVGSFLGILGLAKILDLGTAWVRDRPFDVVDDAGMLGSGLSFVRDSFGILAAAGTVLGAVVLVVAALIGLPWALLRAARTCERHRRGAVLLLAGLTLAWTAASVSGVQSTPGHPVAAAEAVPYTWAKMAATRATLRDRARFDAAIRADPFAAPGSADLSLLRGKDVVIVFVESYGRVAVEDAQAEPIRRLLDGSTARLAAAGYTARSAFLTSPVSGSGSWLAHSSLQAGLRVDAQGRYDRLLRSSRTTLTSAFARAGWDTVAVLPSTRGSWPEGRRFYHLDRVYSGSDLGYAGPTFGFSAMPDQFALAALDRVELDRRNRPPVMAEVELTSSHWPWAPLPTTVDPAALGDGSVYHGIRAGARSAAQLWSDRADVPGAYRASIAYSLTSVLTFVETSRDADLVVLVLGDHQPSTVVTGPGARRDVPVTLIAHDPAVIDGISAWGWQPGLRPDGAAPVWPMEALRDRFLTAFSNPVDP